jgi:hypothetical protein
MSTTNDTHEFDADLAYLNGLANFMFDTIGQHMRHDAGPTIYDRLLTDLSCSARHAISAHGWTIDVDWEQDIAV